MLPLTSRRTPLNGGPTVITISLVHQGALGDTLLLLPLISSLRNRFAPEPVAITLVSKASLGQMLTMMGFIEAFESAEDPVHSKWFAEPDNGKPNSSPAWANADFLISAVSTPDHPWAHNAHLARANKPAVLHNAPTLLFFEPRPPVDHPFHLTDFHRAQLAPLSLPAPSPLLPRHNPDGPVVIHPGAGGDAKCWPRERFLSLGRHLKRLGYLPTYILGEAEQERWGRTLINELKDEFPWYLHMGLYELAERMSRARLYLGNDSGVSHLAGALGIPTLTLFGPTNDTQWRPIGPNVQILRSPVPHESSLDHLDEETVLHAMLAELRKLH